MTSVDPVLIAAAHGTRSMVGMATVSQIVAAVRAARPGLDVREAFVDVAPPFLADVLGGVSGPVVVVPVLLSGGYHVRVDIPAVLTGRTSAVLAPALGPDRLVSVALEGRLAEARGARPPAARVVLVATGSSDALARADVDDAAIDLASLLGRPVEAAVMGGEGLSVTEAVSRFARGEVEVASYLLAEGFFADRLRREAADLGVAVVSGPIGPHPAIVDLILTRWDDARRTVDFARFPAR